MAEISAAMVRELRERTDAPMMECKKALVEANADLTRAEEILRVKLGNRVNKVSSRAAGEGVVSIWLSPDARSGAMVEVNCETDFVAKNAEFLVFSNNLAAATAQGRPEGADALSGLSLGGGNTVEGARAALVGKMGENIVVGRFVHCAAQGLLAQYVHGGRIGVLLDLVGGDASLARDIAMHIAATKPKALDEKGVPEEAIQKERQIARQKAEESGKSAQIVEKIVEGSVQKYLKEVSLLSQPFVKDDSVTVGQLLADRGARVPAFHLYIVGEGFEKKHTDFATEVAAVRASAGGQT